METNRTQQYIADLIERFMAGATSLDEEQVLHDYLLAAVDLPQEWEAYRQMFEYFDAGMETPMPQSRRRQRRWWLAAASLLLLVGMAVLWSLPSTNSTGSLAADVICPPASPPVVVSPGKGNVRNNAKRNLARRQQKSNRQTPANQNPVASPADNQYSEPTSTQETTEAVRSFSEMREQQAMAIRNEVVEAIFEMLPDAHNQLHLATDESGAYAIVPTTLVREL